MKKENEINEGEIRVIGDEKLPSGKFRWRVVIGVLCVVLIVVASVMFWALRDSADQTTDNQAYFEPETVVSTPSVWLSRQSFVGGKEVEIIDTIE